jgi:hypothetical protein
MEKTFHGRIYKLFVEGIEEICYIGSTTQDLKRRLTLHKCSANNLDLNQSASACFFQEDNNVLIKLVEEGPFESKHDMELRERYWIEQTPQATNTNIPTRGWKERWLANHEHNLAKHKEWLAANAEHVKEYSSRPEVKARATQNEKARYDAGYKDVRNSAKKVKVKCEVCGKEMNKNSLWTHKKAVHPKPQ